MTFGNFGDTMRAIRTQLSIPPQPLPFQFPGREVSATTLGNRVRVLSLLRDGPVTIHDIQVTSTLAPSPAPTTPPTSNPTPQPTPRPTPNLQLPITPSPTSTPTSKTPSQTPTPTLTTPPSTTPSQTPTPTLTTPPPDPSASSPSSMDGKNKAQQNATNDDIAPVVAALTGSGIVLLLASIFTTVFWAGRRKKGSHQHSIPMGKVTSEPQTSATQDDNYGSVENMPTSNEYELVAVDETKTSSRQPDRRDSQYGIVPSTGQSPNNPDIEYGQLKADPPLYDTVPPNGPAIQYGGLGIAKE